jgi:hypothetical protein
MAAFTAGPARRQSREAGGEGGQEAARQRPVLAEHAGEALGVGAGPGSALAAHREAHLLRLQHAGGAAGAGVDHERLGHLAGQVLLQHQPVGQGVDELGHLAEADHPPARHVSHVGQAAGGQQVVRADGVEVDGGDGHQLLAPGGHGLAQDLGGIAPVAVEQVAGPGLGHPLRRLLQIGAAPHLGRQLQRVEEARHRPRQRAGRRPPAGRPPARHQRPR